MSRRRRRNDASKAEAIAKAAVGGVLLLAILIGGVQKLPETLAWMGKLALVGLMLLLGLAGLGWVAWMSWRLWQEKRAEEAEWGLPKATPSPAPKPVAALSFDEPLPILPVVTLSAARTEAPPVMARPAASRVIKLEAESAPWSEALVYQRLQEIDWYQFEKFCAAVLGAEGFAVERLGGAQPDGGVDLIASKDGRAVLVQCKHWHTWEVKEKVVRELLGSMTHLKYREAAIYTLKGWTAPAAELARQHAIELVDGRALARRAAQSLAPERLETLLKTGEHHCPKCEAPMVLRTGDFTPFWGCSRYPRCRGRLNER